MSEHSLTPIAAASLPGTLFDQKDYSASIGYNKPKASKPSSETSMYGSFRDSMKAPIHRWFTYPAGYSYKLVEAKIREYGLTKGSWIADPFLGTGTTSVVSKMLGINSLGIEAHPFVIEVAKTKTYFDYEISLLLDELDKILLVSKDLYEGQLDCSNVWPDLIYKCFTTEGLQQLYALRTAILDSKVSLEHKNFFKLALTATLRIVTTAGAGWPYIAPSKYAARTVRRDAFEEFVKRCTLMINDIRLIRSAIRHYDSNQILIKGDARLFNNYAEENSIDLILTSPPYLNNYDYADRTRLETYFWGIYHSWSEITREVRDQLITAATTQIVRTKMNGKLQCADIKAVSPEIHEELSEMIERLSVLRSQKSGKKSYDLLVAGYFEDMLKTITGAYKVLKHKRAFVLVLGDSAPYGIHVPTDEIIGRLAKAVGFSEYTIEVLRARGGKWGHNSQRHKVPLRESILTIKK